MASHLSARRATPSKSLLTPPKREESGRRSSITSARLLRCPLQREGSENRLQHVERQWSIPLCSQLFFAIQKLLTFHLLRRI
ncbi:hypothetical protein HNY73_020301 [Argiope bruennichi]|uniref:Uncharacterized protein n=1 Tax=Argiope bruennichi TaxID=94029 RepID=A0A8T0EA41_ARGBR|nr:hypothetical protein HNY73_020301 [Argiope bruennichi]